MNFGAITCTQTHRVVLKSREKGRMGSVHPWQSKSGEATTMHIFLRWHRVVWIFGLWGDPDDQAQLDASIAATPE